MCTVYSMMNNIHHACMAPGIVKGRFAYAQEQLKMATQLYQMQVQGGRYLLHEHPEGASSWAETCIMDVMKMDGGQKSCGGFNVDTEYRRKDKRALDQQERQRGS